MSFEIDNHGAVPLTTAHRPVIHADDAGRIWGRKRRASYRPQHRVAADRHRQTPGDAASRLSSQRQAQTLQHVVKTNGATTVGPLHRRQALREDSLRTTGRITEELAAPPADDNARSLPRKILERSHATAMNTRPGLTAFRTNAGRPSAADHQASLSGLDRNSFQTQSRRSRQEDARFHGDLRFVFAPPCSPPISILRASNRKKPDHQHRRRTHLIRPVTPTCLRELTKTTGRRLSCSSSRSSSWGPLHLAE